MSTDAVWNLDSGWLPDGPCSGPSTVDARCARPSRPLPREGSAPPMPSSVTHRRSTPFRSVSIVISITFAELCLMALASSSAVQKLARTGLPQLRSAATPAGSPALPRCRMLPRPQVQAGQQRSGGAAPLGCALMDNVVMPDLDPASVIEAVARDPRLRAFTGHGRIETMPARQSRRRLLLARVAVWGPGCRIPLGHVSLASASHDCWGTPGSETLTRRVDAGSHASPQL